MIRPFTFLFGYRVLRISRSAAGELMNLCRVEGLVYRDFEFCGEYACFSCSLPMARRMQQACAARGIAVVSEREYGLPGLLFRYRHRYGIFVGILLFAAVVFFSGRVVWDIRIEGNRALSDAQVLSQLKECGLEVGQKKRLLDVNALENRVLIASDDISWISVNIIGTVANVELRERQAIPEEPEYTASNLVAARNGTIEWFEDVRGNIVAEVGEAVSQGELLVSGVYGDEDSSFRYTAACGRVYARTEHTFEVEIPLRETRKVRVGEGEVRRYLLFFGKELRIPGKIFGKFSGNSGNSYTTCDTINTVEYFRSPGGVRLPVGIRCEYTPEYEEQESVLQEGAAVERALYVLRCRMAEEIPDAVLLKKVMTGELGDESYRLNCRVECIENIALVQEIKIDGIP